MTRSGSGV